MAILFRKAREEDHNVLVDISTRTIRTSYTAFLGQDAVEGWLGSGAVDQYFNRTIPDCVVLEHDTQIVGFSVAKDELIDLMMIDCERHREGLGGTLLCHVETEMFKSHSVLRLESFADNKPANEFYLSQGWKPGDIFDDPEAGIPKLNFNKRQNS